MKRKMMVAVLAVSLACGWVSLGVAGEIGYTLKASEKGFASKPPAEPSSSVIFADAAIGRPAGLVVTAAGTGVFLVTLPFHLVAGSTSEAARGLIGAPGGWTFVRPMGRSDSRFEDPGVFQR